MYQIEKTEERYRDKPWELSYNQRIDRLKEAKTLGQKTVAYLYPGFDSSTFRYRGFNVAETLDYSFNWSGSYFQYTDREELIRDFQYIDVMVLIRCYWDGRMDEFIRLIREKHIRLCYDVDDLIYNPYHMPAVIEALGLSQDAELNFWFGLTQRNYMIAQQCDVLITTNDFLAGYLKKDFEKPCYTLCNYLNGFQERVSEEYFEKKQQIDTQNPFAIGYFSGSPTHVKDISMIMPEIEEFLNNHPETIFKIVGYMELPERYCYLVTKDRIQFVPFQTFVDLQYEQAKVDINVVPLVNNVFSNCKSELKYFESAIVGTVTCATPSFTYANAIKSGQNGFLCKTGDWLKAFEKIYSNANDKQLQRTIREWALREYSGKNQVKKVETILNDIVNM